MALLRRLLERFDREETPADPNEPVVVDVRSLMEGPLVAAALEGAGINCRRIDSFDPVTGITRCQIFVARRSADDALAVLADLR
jgi:hypothetical protein